MFGTFIELMYRIVNGFRENILPMFNFLTYEFTFNNLFTPTIGDEITLSVGGMLFGAGLIVLLTYKIILSLTPIA